jgi:hypothetical protein
MFQGKVQEAQDFAKLEIQQQEKDKLYLDEMKKKVDLDYKMLQVIIMQSCKISHKILKVQFLFLLKEEFHLSY